MALSEVYDLDSVRNRTAEAVYERIEQVLEEGRGLCRCQDCILDLVAFVLNRVTPRYTTSILGNLHPDASAERRIRVEIDLAVEAGLKRLREHPHHE